MRSNPTAGSIPAGELRTVALNNLVEDSRFQVRENVDAGTVEKYRLALRNDAVLPPVKVAMVNGALVLVDGWHRVAAHRRLGRDRIEAEVFIATEEEAVWAAAQANLTHGLPLKPKEVRRAFQAFVRARKYRLGRTRLMPLRDIARHLGGISHESIRRWMREDFPNVAARYSQGGGDKRADPRPRDPSATFAEDTEAALRGAIAASRGVTCPHWRGALVALAEEALKVLREGGPWEIPAMEDEPEAEPTPAF
ncbi:MAG TPA: ParB N-terminal domain-containing protein [Roseomonas sp.]|nr:ParB N-terminal domain-containing protein [Roseomonas sp.]